MKDRAALPSFQPTGRDADDYQSYMMGRGAAANARSDPFFDMFDQMTAQLENGAPGSERAFGLLQQKLQQYMMSRARSAPRPTMFDADAPPDPHESLFQRR